MSPPLEHLRQLTRRHFLKDSALGLGAIALASLMKDDSASAAANDDPLAPRPPHFAPRAKRVIYLHLTGSPPNLDLYDYKPELIQRDGLQLS